MTPPSCMEFLKHAWGALPPAMRKALDNVHATASLHASQVADIHPLRCAVPPLVQVSVSPWRVENAGLLTSGAVFAYTAWILWSALTSEPDTYHCVFANDTVAGNAAVKVPAHPLQCLVGGGIGPPEPANSAEAMCCRADCSGLHGHLCELCCSAPAGRQPAQRPPAHWSKSFEVESQLPEDDMLTYRPDFFHTVFALASAYLCMLYLNWNLNELPGQQPDQRFTVSLLGRISAGLDAVLSGRGARWLHLHPMRSS